MEPASGATEEAGGPKTHAEASRQRRDVASGAVMAESALVRLVLGPEGVLTPDLARKLPGRGVWVAATRSAVEQAVKRDAFARSLKTKALAPAHLADLIQALLEARVLSGLGLAKKAGDLISGFDKVAALAASGRARWLVEAADGAADGRRKILNAARQSSRPPELFGVFDSAALGVALGSGECDTLRADCGAWSRALDRRRPAPRRLPSACPDHLGRGAVTRGRGLKPPRPSCS